MQITLNQDEIETAIKRYVNEQVAIREDQEISIDLRAGRGENGFSANIDIVAAGSKPKAPADTTAAKQSEGPKPPRGILGSSAKAAAQTPTSIPKVPAPAVQKSAEPEATPEPGPENTNLATAGEEGAAPGDTQAESGASDAGDSAGEAEAPPASEGDQPRKSLFGNLQKPRNN